MPKAKDSEYPHRSDVLDYLTDYERHYQLPIYRPHHVQSVIRDNDALRVSDGKYSWLTKTVISTTGTWSHAQTPSIPGQQTYRGSQCHSAQYEGPEAFSNKRVLVVGGGNSGAQIVAELADMTSVTWVTRNEPLFLPDDVDGRVLFERATARIKGNGDCAPIGGIGDIVMIPTVKAARDKGQLTSVRMFERFTEHGVIWPDGSEEKIDAIIWCTGFKPELQHLTHLDVIESDGTVNVVHGQSIKEPRLWLFGYGDWASPGSATLIGAGRSARENVPKLIEFLKHNRLSMGN